MANQELTLEQIAHLTGSQLLGDPHKIIRGLSSLDKASAQEVSFLDNPRYVSHMLNSQAGAIFITPEQATGISDKNLLLHDSPSAAFQTLIHHFLKSQTSSFTSIHPTAVIAEGCQIDPSVIIGPYVVIDQGVTIGAESRIDAGCFIGAEVEIGTHTHLYPHVVIREGVKIGHHVILQPGVVIGSCGFGYLTNSHGHHHKLEQVGNVVIHDHVEVGANTNIDRARFQTTSIGRGTKLDGLVKIGHGVVLGEDNLIVAQTGIAGSTTTGNRVIMGGQVGVVGHITIADDVILTARTGVSKSLEKGIYSGQPAIARSEHNRQLIAVKQLVRYMNKRSFLLKFFLFFQRYFKK